MHTRRVAAKRKLNSKEAVKCAIPSLLFHNSGIGHAVVKCICLGNSPVLLFLSTIAANTNTLPQSLRMQMYKVKGLERSKENLSHRENKNA